MKKLAFLLLFLASFAYSQVSQPPTCGALSGNDTSGTPSSSTACFGDGSWKAPGGGGSSPSGTTGDLQDYATASTLGAAHINDNGTTMTVTESITPLAAAAKNLGTAPLPFGDLFVGGAANHSFHFDTSAVVSNVAVAVPNHASNTVQGIANPSDTQVVNYVGTDGVQNRVTLAAEGICASTNSSPSYTASGTTTFAIASAPCASATISTTHSTSTTLALTGPYGSTTAHGYYDVYFVGDSTGGAVTITLGGGCTWKVSGGGSGALPTVNVAASEIDKMHFEYDGTNCYASYIPLFN